MQARTALVRGRNDVVMEAVELDHEKPRPGEALLETLATFISAGTELAIYTGLDPGVDDPDAWCHYPFRPGYANVSRVVAVGEGVDWAAPGQRVFTLHGHTSHHFTRGRGHDMAVPVPESIEDGVAAAARMAMVAITGIQVSDVELNDWVAVFGLGTVGNLACQFFQLRGARVIGIDPVDARRELARQCGVEHVIGGAAHEVADAVRALTGGKGARTAVDAVGDVRVVTQAAQLTENHGEVIILGSPRASVQADLNQALRPIHYRWVTFKGALEWRIPREPAPPHRTSTRGNLEMIYDLIQRGKLHVEPLISHRMPAERIKDAYEGLLNRKDEYTGVVLEWAGTRP